MPWKNKILTLWDLRRHFTRFQEPMSCSYCGHEAEEDDSWWFSRASNRGRIRLNSKSSKFRSKYRCAECYERMWL